MGNFYYYSLNVSPWWQVLQTLTEGAKPSSELIHTIRKLFDTRIKVKTMEFSIENSLILSEMWLFSFFLTFCFVWTFDGTAGCRNYFPNFAIPAKRRCKSSFLPFSPLYWQTHAVGYIVCFLIFLILLLSLSGCTHFSPYGESSYGGIPSRALSCPAGTFLKLAFHFVPLASEWSLIYSLWKLVLRDHLSLALCFLHLKF